MKQLKILVTGPTRAGKSTIVKALTRGKSVSIDKHGTTVALDHGVIEVRGIKMYLFGTPGLEHFSILRKILATGADGILFMVDSSDKKNDSLAKRIWREISVLAPTIPCIAVANKQDLPGARKPDDLRQNLNFLVGVPVIPVSAAKGTNLNTLIGALLLLIVLEWSPLLKKVDSHSGSSKGLELFAKDLQVGLDKAKNYLRWLEFRELIKVDWRKSVFYLKKELKEMLETPSSALSTYR